MKPADPDNPVGFGKPRGEALRAVRKLLGAIGLVTVASPMLALPCFGQWGTGPVLAVGCVLGATGLVALLKPLPWLNLGSHWRAVVAVRAGLLLIGMASTESSHVLTKEKGGATFRAADPAGYPPEFTQTNGPR